MAQYHLHLKGYVGGYDFDSDYVDYILAKYPDSEVNVLIDSLGGSLATALSIMAAFRNHGNVHVHFVGMNASAATIASMGANRITMDSSAMYLVHKCSVEFFERALANLDKLAEIIREARQMKSDLENCFSTHRTPLTCSSHRLPEDVANASHKLHHHRQDRPGSSNSLTLSWLLIDEAKFIDYNRLKDETLPANGGIKSYFGKHSCNHSIMILSNKPQTKKGSWFFHYKDKMDTEVIAAIEGLVYDIWRVKDRMKAYKEREEQVPKHLYYILRHKDRHLNQLRSVATYYKEYSSIENLQLLGENYIRQMKRDLTPLTFQTSIICQRIGIAKEGFYSSMREKHKYDASDFDYLDSLGYDTIFDEYDNEIAQYSNSQINSKSSIVNSKYFDSRADKDCNPNAPICIGMDYNANINWIVAGQPVGRRLNILKVILCEV